MCHGEGVIPATGYRILGLGVEILVQSAASTVGITFSEVASILRGIWLLTSTSEAFSLDMEIYVGGTEPAFYCGTVAITISPISCWNLQNATARSH